ncbi:MAG: hypothetical protein A3D94_22285 [Alphaproteobacteria bacterium RIFCSPHIGHO2_12_FULL_66_14]|jgi:hypothetical protein|nr:MAG: hypothetical protein A3D94_22285 [Alphaproteobacteria bacterium RIFCSPHIGHO2_12_FULL_66_14]
MSLLRRHVFALPLAVLASSTSAQTGWIVVQSADNSFLVDMPGAPIYKVIDTATPAGTRFVYHSYSLEYRRLSFVAQTALYPAEVDVARPRANLQMALDDRAQRIHGNKWTQVDWKQVQGAPAVESIGPIAGGSALRQLVVLKGRRFVSLGYLAPADAMRAPEAERFFRSLRLLS